MKKRICLLCLLALTLVSVAPAADKKFTLVIDAGHGGKDAGACGAVSKEKNLTLKYALAFGALVERNCPDVKVIYTRKTDTFLELWQRAEKANNNKADLFVSVHINSLGSGKQARGFQTYTLGKGRNTGKKGINENLEVAKRENSVILMEKDYKQTYQGFDPNSPESSIMFEFIQDKNMERSVDLARMMQRQVCAATGRADMGAHQDNLAVLRLTSMPGCLVELGFISTPDEEQFLNSAGAVDRYAKGLYNAFIAYKKKYGSNSGITYKTERVDRQPASESAAEKPRPTAADKEKERQREARKEAHRRAQQGNTAETAARRSQAPAGKTAENVAKHQPASDQPTKTSPKAQEPADQPPVFKVQIMTSNKVLPAGNSQLKGLDNVGHYEEGGMVKYTIGASTNYNEIRRLRESVLSKFPQAFIIAFKNGQKMDVNQAIREFKAKKN